MTRKWAPNKVKAKTIAKRWRKKGYEVSSPYKVKKGYAIAVHKK